MRWERPHMEQSTEEGKAAVPSAHVKLRQEVFGRV